MVVILLALSAIATFMFGRYALQRGRKTGSPTLIAEGHHRQSDVFSSLVVLLSASLTYFGIDFRLFGMGIDHIAAGVILVFIAVAGWRLLMDGMRVLLDASVDQETLEAVREIISQEPAVVGIRSIVGRSSGRFRFIQAAITLRTDDLKRAHDISSRIEQAIHDQVPHVGRIMIHYEPETEPQRRLAVPMDDTRDTICDHFGAAPYFVIFTIDRNARQILGKSFEKNPHRERTHAKGIRVAEWLVQHHHIDAIYLRTDIRHKGPGYVFANAGVQMQLLDTGDLNEVSEAFFETPVKYEPAADRKFEG
jgi:predicted Fe-Mo cluster-binding NifX family protein